MTDEKKSRTHDPSYHVFKLQNPAGHMFEHLTHDAAVKAANREAAIERVAGPTHGPADGYLVIKAAEFQTFTHRTKHTTEEVIKPGLPVAESLTATKPAP